MTKLQAIEMTMSKEIKKGWTILISAISINILIFVRIFWEIREFSILKALKEMLWYGFSYIITAIFT